MHRLQSVVPVITKRFKELLRQSKCQCQGRQDLQVQVVASNVKSLPELFELGPFLGELIERRFTTEFIRFFDGLVEFHRWCSVEFAILSKDQHIVRIEYLFSPCIFNSISLPGTFY